MPVVVTILATAVLLWVGSYPAKLLFYAAWERMTKEYPAVTKGNLSREQGASDFTRIIKDRSCLDEAMEAIESKVSVWAASFGAVQWVGLVL